MEYQKCSCKRCGENVSCRRVIGNGCSFSNVGRQGAALEESHSQKCGMESVRWRYQFVASVNLPGTLIVNNCFIGTYCDLCVA